MAEAGMLAAQFRHGIPGRTRIRLETPLPSAGRLEELADRLSALDGIRAVDINPETGSVLFRHESDVDPLAAAKQAELIETAPAPAPEPINPTDEILRRVGQLDALVGRASGGRLDAAEVTIVGLVVTGMVQVARGKIAGPALTLFGQAVTLAMARPLRKFLR